MNGCFWCSRRRKNLVFSPSMVRHRFIFEMDACGLSRGSLPDIDRSQKAYRNEHNQISCLAGQSLWPSCFPSFTQEAKTGYSGLLCRSIDRASKHSTKNPSTSTWKLCLGLHEILVDSFRYYLQFFQPTRDDRPISSGAHITLY